MFLRGSATAVGSGLVALAAIGSRRGPARSETQVDYYGSYKEDRFGGGIGRRVGLDESGKRSIPGTSLVRVVLIKDTHKNLAKWATEENWKEATRIHKSAYFTRTSNPVQEALLERIRQHYVSPPGQGLWGYTAKYPVQAALFRVEDTESFREQLTQARVLHIPTVVFGKFDEQNESCIVDFANKRLGGGWLGYGHVQEEIMFTERFDVGVLCARSLLQMPENPVTEPVASPFSMKANEAWIIKGCPRFAHLSWYGRVPDDWEQQLKLLNPKDDQNSAPTLICMDAIKADFPKYQRKHLDMMLLKAYCGFAAARSDPDVGCQTSIATGSWGCGAFYNNECVMFVIQTLAASVAGVKLTHHVLGDGKRLAPAFEFLEDVMVKKLSVAQAMAHLEEKCLCDEMWQSKFKPGKGKFTPDKAIANAKPSNL
eukprot:TRINITY_DN75595_c0_g1_i1.p1 TRINITY_DN75595_c0_g1~~TRINITY_DN75595_c0_g1_i1.p1  ORF type:complete len:427 (-),score=59.78 TRINITY_DN75595_c0_g1_i1:71-1351(-)